MNIFPFDYNTYKEQIPFLLETICVKVESIRASIPKILEALYNKFETKNKL